MGVYKLYKQAYKTSIILCEILFIMKKEIHFKNFGKVKDARIRMRPFTMITGHNSSGKSFITRALYSIFHTLNQRLMAVFLKNILNSILLSIESINENLVRKTVKDESALIELQTEFYHFRTVISEQFDLVDIYQEREILSTLEPAIKELSSRTEALYKQFSNGKGTKLISVEQHFNALQYNVSQLRHASENWSPFYAQELKSNLKNNLLKNFQINSLKQISFVSEQTSIEFDSKENGEILIENGDLDAFFISFSTISEIQELYNVIYLESPIYFKLRNTLREARFQNSIFNRKNLINPVPKFFYDTDRLLSSQFLEDNIPIELLEIIGKIEKGIDGKLSIDNRDNIVFQDNELPNVEIPFNLVSSGISNLGIVALLLKKNILTKGSFLFIDEPELNLHTEWQHLMLEVLVDLSLAGINVMVASHSLDMVLRLQNIVENFENQEKIDDLFSLNRLSKNGTTLESEGILQDIRNAKADLGKPYVDLLKQRLP